MQTLRKKSALSRAAALGIVLVVIVVIVVGASIALRTRSPNTTSSTSSEPTLSVSSSTQTTFPAASSSTHTTPTAPSFQLKPTNSSQLTDDSWPGAPDDLDPATGFSVPDQPVFNSVFQELVEFNGTSISQVVPVLAQNYSIQNNYERYVFTIRPNVTFSNGDPLNAYAVWFSYVRELYLGQAVGISNFGELTVNTSQLCSACPIIPWGIDSAIQAVTGLQAVSNPNVTEEVLNNVLSHFNPSNQTIQKIMGYPNQAYVVLGPMTFEINLLVHYRFFLVDTTSWWGAVVDPAYVDAHGGVQANTPNSYFDANSGPGTGPYEIRSIGAELSDVVLQPNPNYWALSAKNVPEPAEPPHIPIIVINYNLEQTTQIQDFANNIAQISFVSSPSYFEQMYSSYKYNHYYSFDQIFHDLGLGTGLSYLSMNTQIYPTNNTDFRLAIVHAINYTQVLSESYGFNSTVYGANYVGPITPLFPGYYNPGDLPIYSYDLNLAAYYLNLAGQQEHFSVTLPNGSILGDASAPQLSTLTIDYITPETPLTQLQLEIIAAGLSKIGLSIGLQGVTYSVYTSWTSPQQTPNFVYNTWYPDWPDPILQQMIPAVTTTSYLPAWVNLTQINHIVQTLPFITNQTQQIQLVEQVYNITYNYAPYVWLPTADNYLFIQPYVGGFVFNEYIFYYYNTLYYTTS
jgi:peptide/nickel transport system substrate-binding protein